MTKQWGATIKMLLRTPRPSFMVVSATPPRTGPRSTSDRTKAHGRDEQWLFSSRSQSAF
jgi:hypothetical protein